MAPITARTFLSLFLFHEWILYEEKNSIIDPNGRYILPELTIQESPFLLFNLYAPTKIHDQTEFFNAISSFLQSVDFDSDCKLIIGGDFNTHLDTVLDNSGRKIETKPSVKYLKDIMLACNLIDIWDELHKT